MKAGVVGAGRLGGTLAFTLAHDRLFDELVLCDIAEELVWAQAEDIRHGLVGVRETVVRTGAIEDLRGADAVVLCAGQSRKPGMSRLDLLRANAPVVASLSREIAGVAPDAILIVLTNPMDVMTGVAARLSGLARQKVVGSGAYVDSMRFRILIAESLGVPVSQVDATILGEHGDRFVPVFSHARVRGKPTGLDAEAQKGIAEKLRGLSARVIAGKGWTSYGPAGCTAALIRALLAPGLTTVPASVLLAGEYGIADVALGVPVLVGHGHVKRVEEWNLADDELQGLREAGRELAKYLKDALQQAEAGMKPPVVQSTLKG